MTTTVANQQPTDQFGKRQIDGSAQLGLDLARNLMTIREYLKTTPPDVPKAVAVLNETSDSLFPLTGFHKGAHYLHHTYVKAAPLGHKALMESLGEVLMHWALLC